MTASDRRDEACAQTAAQLLADWHVELGYLQHADALQIMCDTFGDAIVKTTESGARAIRRDVLDAFHALSPAVEWTRCVEWWER